MHRKNCSLIRVVLAGHLPVASFHHHIQPPSHVCPQLPPVHACGIYLGYFTDVGTIGRAQCHYTVHYHIDIKWFALLATCNTELIQCAGRHVACILHTYILIVLYICVLCSMVGWRSITYIACRSHTKHMPDHSCHAVLGATITTHACTCAYICTC